MGETRNPVPQPDWSGPMPRVACPSCRRRSRVRHRALGQTVVCPHCAAPFGAEEDYRPIREPLSYYKPRALRPWQEALGLVVLVLVAAVTLTVEILMPKGR